MIFIFSDAANHNLKRVVASQRKPKSRICCWCYCSADPQSTVCKCEECYTMDVWYVRCYSRVKVCVCISERRRYLGLCDESVSVASKVLQAACRLLIHIHRGWLQSVADDTGRCWEMEEDRRKRDKWTKKLCAGWSLMSTIGKTKFKV